MVDGSPATLPAVLRQVDGFPDLPEPAAIALPRPGHAPDARRMCLSGQPQLGADRHRALGQGERLGMLALHDEVRPGRREGLHELGRRRQRLQQLERLRLVLALCRWVEAVGDPQEHHRRPGQPSAMSPRPRKSSIASLSASTQPPPAAPTRTRPDRSGTSVSGRSRWPVGNERQRALEFATTAAEVSRPSARSPAIHQVPDAPNRAEECSDLLGVAAGADQLERGQVVVGEHDGDVLKVCPTTLDSIQRATATCLAARAARGICSVGHITGQHVVEAELLLPGERLDRRRGRTS